MTYASVYDLDGNTITTGLEPSTVSDQAIQIARELAADHGRPVILEDDGDWIVEVDGTIVSVGAAR